jgi:large conductance mechanosensitive channel
MIKSQLSEFKKFILRGNVVDLAVGVAIGAAFTSVVTALVKDFITPLVSTVPGIKVDPNAYFDIAGGRFLYGDFLNVLLSFLLTAAVIFFIVVQPVNKLTALANKGKKTEDPTTKKCPECLSEIPRDARRCKFCTAQLSTGDKPKADTTPPAKSDIGTGPKPPVPKAPKPISSLRI